MATIAPPRDAPAIAIFPWGEVIEEFLDPLALTLEDFAGKMTGGWLFGYAAALQSQGWRPIIICTSETVSQPTRLVHDGTGAALWAVPGQRSGISYEMPNRRCIRQWRKSPWRAFAAVLAKEKCAAIIAQEYEYFRFDLLALLARRMGVLVYATFQGGDLTWSAIERLVRPWSMRRCAGLIVASARERARIAKAYGGNLPPIADIPNPLDTDEWRPQERQAARAALGLPFQSFIVINHGRTEIQRKGLDILLESWKRFAEAHPDARAILVGSGGDHDAFADLLAREAPARVSWIDRYITDRAEMRRWLSAADAYLITSRTEGMPVAPLEAMACGLPVIASDAHGLPDIFAVGERHGGILVPREDVPATVQALERLVRDPDLRIRLGTAARRRVEDRFSIPAVGAALSNLLGSHRNQLGIASRHGFKEESAQADRDLSH